MDNPDNRDIDTTIKRELLIQIRKLSPATENQVDRVSVSYRIGTGDTSCQVLLDGKVYRTEIEDKHLIRPIQEISTRYLKPLANFIVSTHNKGNQPQ